MIGNGTVRDTLFVNSFFTLATSVVTAAGGFLFWTLNARLFTAAQVGLAGALLGACSTISSGSLLGFNQTLVRRLHATSEPSRLLNTSLLLVAAAGTTVAAGYALIVPALVPDLGPIRSNLPIFVAFVLVSAMTGVNLATDAIFVGHQQTRLNFVIDGVLQNVVKLALPPMLGWLGAYGMFFSAGAATLAAVMASVLVLVRWFDYRPRLEIDRQLVRSEFAFSSGTYVAELLDLVPPLVMPLLIVRALGPESAAAYFIAFQMAGLLYTGVFAVSQSTFAEGCRQRESLRALTRRAGRLLMFAPVGGLVMAGAGPVVLGLVGPEYRAGGTGTLVVFSLGAAVVAPTALSTALLRLTGQIGAMVAMAVLRNGATCLLALLLLSRGLIWAALAWVAGEAVSLIVPAWALARRAVWKARS
ncbi:lipopolysaccharide biosynthesis protein [Paractinoplanes globisporus]|uniref:Lipopolysaccharide biosynthesis protein n=1 Tax=Paractinoplanes globisporus TaxID=113565 RepID=A0ABW6WDV5_9ACTN|nr:oligosaccharide flippase family protein [Actinoplanes globisporus]